MKFALGAAVLPLLPAPTAAAAAAAAVPSVPSPATVLTVFPWEGSMEDELQGTLCRAPNNCVQIRQFLWDPNGITTIETTIDATPGTKVVFSYSEGARSVADWMEQHADDSDAPSPDELSFVLIGNPTRAYGGSDKKVMPQTQYQVIDVSRQYDPASDFPDDPTNFIALLNSLAAFTVIHTDYEGVDMYDPANIVWKEGNTTYVFVPTEELPLLAPLRNLGLTGLADALNGPLKEIVERAYDRSYLPTAPEGPADTSALSLTSTRAERIPGPSEADRGDSTATETTSAASPPKSSDPPVAAPLPISGPGETAADEPGTVDPGTVDPGTGDLGTGDLGTVDLGADDLDDTAATPNDATTLPAEDASPESVPEDDIDIDDSLATVDAATDSTSLAAQETSSGSSTSDERLDRTSVSASVTGHKATNSETAAAKENDRDGVSADHNSGDGDS
ncbi:MULTISPECIES: PE-PPE domain-containing protein [Mycobacteriaceae]|uniref:PE-PPE domain-containing protein n=1 Tax=Mycolicibacterium parafortuitum TaxID=39692 RepID=A0ACC6MEW0_MYCPF|nr:MULTISPECIES: PE-PPE domain-containing protein [Mycobacteriaceae]MDZ5085480.1 PE-PPE domain-containing protein [Mycolicibacterium parafortuitum]